MPQQNDSLILWSHSSQNKYHKHIITILLSVVIGIALIAGCVCVFLMMSATLESRVEYRYGEYKSKFIYITYFRPFW
jgi:flagellar basal body-associated protein FliL